MGFKYSDSEVLKLDVTNFMKPDERRAFDEFVKTHGLYFGSNPCPFCNTSPRLFHKDDVWRANGKEEAWQDNRLLVCPTCLWFRGRSSYYTHNLDFVTANQFYATYARQDKPVADLALEQLQSHLARHWNDRKEISAKQAEDLVASVFANHLDAEIHYTTNGVFVPDGGIDFVLVEGSSGVQTAFQVKRRLTDNPERVQAIREFVGAVTLKGYDRGYFVTFAPRLTKAAATEIKESEIELSRRGMSIQVVDGSRFHEILRNTNRVEASAGHWLLTHKDVVGLPDADEWFEVAPPRDNQSDSRQRLSESQYSLRTIFSELSRTP